MIGINCGIDNIWWDLRGNLSWATHPLVCHDGGDSSRTQITELNINLVSMAYTIRSRGNAEFKQLPAR